MRLLNVETLRLETWVDPPPYAILSHVWMEQEVLFHDIQQGEEHMKRLKGFSKVQGACNQAKLDMFCYIWIDTCCIDKSSSAELSEAINSMFKWYQKSRTCYAYLADVDIDMDDDIDRDDLQQSRWFRRGWTLQELIAPKNVELYDWKWRSLGNRSLLATQLSYITGIHESVLTMNHPFGSHKPEAGRDGRCSTCGARATIESILRTHSIATRMSWAAQRKTTREEDEAYCLMGLFGVNMPLLYGEGRKAFLRLQREIVASSNDQSILVHTGTAPEYGAPFSNTIEKFKFFAPISNTTEEFLAPSPAHFSHKVSMGQLSSPVILDKDGLSIELLLCPCDLIFGRQSGKVSATIGILECHSTSNDLSRFAIFMQRVDGTRDTYQRLTTLLLELGPNVKSPLGRGDVHGWSRSDWKSNLGWFHPEKFEELHGSSFETAMTRVYFDLAQTERSRVRLLGNQTNPPLSMSSMPYCAIRTIIQPATDQWTIQSFPASEASTQNGIEVFIPGIKQLPRREDFDSNVYDLGTRVLLFLGQDPKSLNGALIAVGYASQLVPWCRIVGHTPPWDDWYIPPLICGSPHYEGLLERLRITLLNQKLSQVESSLESGEIVDIARSLKQDSCVVDDRSLEVAIEPHYFMERHKLEISIKISERVNSGD
ncbi:heterokaryon incompatibility protein-domain-containing protein [Diplogelasinospora grovesii]|uniref:Heterokaryon incompatibility protein-domain-containing protein n=1 Tax=Diplogelasinospora grovesii TaxID=303347 RepID=A0AAN6RZN8_9PEZI|nr:heterokaryon incompatibility protein-domain-containing protein [Diplogelasinospora grovesii]